MFGVLHDVDRVRVDREHGSVIVGFGEELIVGVIQLVDVTAFHVALIRTVAQGDALHQNFCVRSQIDK